MKALLLWGSGILVILYPFVVYFGLQIFSPAWLAVILLAMLVTRLWFTSPAGNNLRWLKWVPTTAIPFLLISLLADDSVGILVYPIAINLTMLAVFALSLLRPPTIIESLARLQQPNLPEKGVVYTRRVTQIWCLFFATNALFSGYTALFSTMEVWMIYNGMIAYFAIGTLLGGEWLYRKCILKV